ncbi:MAG: hypothetical protein AAF937_10860 [Planctomycetota bacterium]
METHEPRHDHDSFENDAALEAVQRAEQAERLAAVSDFDAPPQKRRRWLKISGGLVLVLLVLVGIAPLIAGPLLTPVAEKRLAEALDATVRIDAVSLNWFGKPRIEGLVILDESLQEQANLTARFGSSLLSLALSPGDLDEVVVSGSLKLERRPDGSIAPFPKPDPSSTGPAALPTLDVILSARDLDIEWRGADAEPVRLAGIDGALTYRPGSVAGGISFDLEHPLLAARVEADCSVSGLAVGDGIFGIETGGLAVSVEGDAADAALDVVLSRSEAGYRVTMRGDEITARAGGELLAGVVPTIGEIIGRRVALSDGRLFAIETVPGLSVRLNDAALTLDPRTLALSDTRFEAVIETGELAGTLDGAPWRIEPLLATAATRNMIDGIDIEAATTVSLDGSRAGELSLLSDGLSVLRPDGGFMRNPTTMIAGSRTSLDVSEVSTPVIGPLLSPLLERAGLVLARDFGPSISLELAVSPGDRTGFRIDLDSDNVTAAVGLRVDNGMLTTTADATRVSVRSAAGYLSELLAATGATIEEGASADIRLGDVTFDLAAQSDTGPLDLTALSGIVNVALGPTSGSIRVGDEAKSFALRASEAEIDLRRLREQVTLAAGSAVELDGRSAGSLNVSLTASDLLAPSGALRSGVPRVSGEVAVRNVRTALLGPWLEPVLAGTGLAPSRLLGESADLLVIGTPGTGGEIALETTLRSGGFAGGGSLVLAERTIRSAGTMRFQHTNAGAIAADLLPESLRPSLTPEPGGTLALELDSLELGERGLVGFDAAVAIGDLSARSGAGADASIERINASLSLGQGVRVAELNGLGSFGGSPLVLGGRLQFDAPDTGLDRPAIWWLDPEGRVDVTLPAELFSLVAPELAAGSRDILALTVGDALEVSLTAAGGTLAVAAEGSGGGTRFELAAASEGRDLRVESVSAVADITDEAIRQLRLSRLASGQQVNVGPSAGATIASEARVALDVGSFGLLEDGSWNPSGNAELRLSASGAIDGLRDATVMGSDGLPRRSREGAIGVRGLVLRSTLPMGALLSDRSASLSGEVSGSLIGDGDSVITEVVGSLNAEVASGVLAGPVALRIQAPSIDAASLDDSLRTDSFVSGLLGASASASVELAGIGEAGTIMDAGLTIAISSPRLRTDGPLAFDIRPDRVVLASPARVRYDANPVFATRHALNQSPGEERVRLAEPVQIEINVDRLAIARGGKPFRPGVFDAHAELASPRLVFQQRVEVEQGDDITAAPWITSDFSPIVGELMTDADSGARLVLNAGNDEHSLLAEIGLRGVSEGSPVLGVVVEGRRVPSRLLDGLGNFGGGLAEILGPTTQVRLAVNELSRTAGGVNFSLIGDRASASMIGRIEDGVFRNEDPIVAQIDVIRPQLGARLSRAVPVLGRVTKSREDGPATLTVTNVAFTLGEEPGIRGLDADIVIDVGTARFQASRAFGDVLVFARQRADNEVGRRLEAMTGTIRGGVLDYDPLELPLGEFTITSAGTYDFTTRRTNVMTAIPLGALSDKAMGELNTGVGSSLSRIIPGLRELTMVPWRVKGTPGNLTITPDIEEFTRQITRTINPVNIIGNIFGG